MSSEISGSYISPKQDIANSPSSPSSKKDESFKWNGRKVGQPEILKILQDQLHHTASHVSSSVWSFVAPLLSGSSSSLSVDVIESQIIRKISYNPVIDDAPVTFSECRRLLLLDGDDGTVACRIYGNLMTSTIPKISDNGTLEYATRSLLRMNNLTAVRGVPGSSMVGPIDYLGNLEEPHKYLYTIKNQFPPLFYRKPITEIEDNIRLKEFDSSLVTTVKANWVSGRNQDAIQEKNEEYNVTPRNLRQSLFRDPGLMEIDRKLIELKYFDHRGVNLSSFKARVVDNQIPFQITKKELRSKDDYRMVTYLYEPNYADWQVQHGSGLFLERHEFSQTITPITPDSKGFVVLARTNDTPNELELIGIQIPYGFTLVIEEDCIHGDTTLNGFFMMGMTSDHTTMRTADTVFLKYPQTKENVKMVMVGSENASAEAVEVPAPYVIYKDPSEADREKFRELTSGKNFIFNPFSREHWKK